MRTASIIVAAALVAMSMSTPARAESPDSTREALRLAYEADDLFARGRWDEAHDRFAAADRLAHSPVFTLFMARCRRNANRLIEAARIYEVVAAEAVKPTYPKQFRDAIADAGRELGDTRSRTPALSVIVRGAPLEQVTVKIDRETVGDWSRARAMDPGEHVIDASAPGFASRSERVRLDAGASPSIVEIQFAEDGPKASRSYVAPAVAGSLGLVALGVGTWAGLTASSRADALLPSCADGHCRRTDADELRAAGTVADVSTAAFVIAGVSLAVAAVLLVLPGATARPARAASGATGVSF